MPITHGDGSQSGDTNARDLAGESIYHYGLSAEQLTEVMRQQTEFYLSLVSAYERQYSEVQKQLGRLRDENDMYRAGERAARDVRQRELDRRLLLLAGSVATLAIAIGAVAAHRRWSMR